MFNDIGMVTRHTALVRRKQQGEENAEKVEKKSNRAVCLDCRCSFECLFKMKSCDVVLSTELFEREM